MAESRLSILLQARNNASAEIQKVRKDVQGLGSTRMGGGMSADFEELKNRVLGTNEAFGLLSKGAVAVGVAVGALKLGQLAFDMGKATAGSLRLADSFNALAAQAGQSGDAMLAAMRKAARGTVDDTTLIASANRAMLLGVADNAESMTKLIEVAAVRGKAMGLSTAQAFGDIVTGIGRMSPVILDNLGIIVDAAKANETYAQSIGKSAAQLTDAEKKQALLNAVIASSAGLMKGNASTSRDMAGDFEAMSTSIANAQDALGALFTPYAAAIARNLAEVVDQLTASMQEAAKSPLEKTIDDQVAKMTDLERTVTRLQSALTRADPGTQAYDELSIALGQAQRSLEAQRVLTDALARAQGDAVTGTEKLSVAMNALANAKGPAEGLADAAAQAQELADRMAFAESLGKSAGNTLKSSFMNIIDVVGINEALSRYQTANIVVQEQIALWTDAGYSVERIEFLTALMVGNIQSGNSALSGTISQLSEVERIAASAAAQIKSSFLGMASLAGASQSFQQYRQATGELETQIGLWESMGLSAEEVEFNTAQFVQGVQSANSELRKTVTATGSVASGVGKIDQAFNNIKGKIQGILSGSLKSGIDLDSILPRQDAVEEDARRLADIAVNGYQSPWVKYFQEKFPAMFAELGAGGDIKGAAARILRDFEDGLRPELMNKEAVKDKVRRMLLGEGNIEGLAAEIARELSGEFGNQFSQAQILQKAQAALGTGGELSAGFSVDRNIAGNVLGQIEGQFTDEKATGKARAIGASFMVGFFDGAFDLAEGLPFWDKLLAIIIRQQITAGA